MSSKSIEEQKHAARNTNELLDHLRRIIEQNDERFSFEWLVGGEHATMEIFDKEKKIGYAVKIEPIVSDDVCEWKQASTARYKTSCGYKLEEYFDTNACYCKQCGKKIKVVE